MTTIVIFGILFLVLLKPIFLICAYSLSFIYFHFIKNKTNLPQELSSSNSLEKTAIRKTLGRHTSGIISYSIFETGKIPFHSVRNFIYRHLYKVNMEKNTIIYGGAELRDPHKLILGQGSIVGHYSILDARNFIEIGENVNFSHGVWLWTEQHNHNSPDFGCESTKNKKITIHDRVWLGPRVTVLPGCTIGEGAVVGAGSVVTTDIEPFSINAGIPAKKIGERNRSINYVFDGKPLPYI